MSLLSNFRKRGFKDILNPKKWKIFIRSKALKLLKLEYSEMFSRPYIEQISIRMSNEGCRECLAKGECIHCGCKSPDLFYEKDMECSGMNWFGMMSPEDWDKYKENNVVEIDEDYINQIKKYGKIIKFK